jgi:hypothetical protein
VTAEVVEDMDRMLMARLMPGEQTLEKIMRYETRLHRFLLQSVHQLVLLRGLARRGRGRCWGLSDLNPPGLRGEPGLPPSS